MVILNFVYTHQVLAELKKSNFTLLNQSIQFDENGDPKFGSYSIVFWNNRGDAVKVGFYKFHPLLHFYINSSKIHWYTKGEVSCFFFLLTVYSAYVYLKILCFSFPPPARTQDF